MKFKKIIFASLIAVSVIAANFGNTFAKNGTEILNKVSDVKVLKATSESDNSSESSSSNPAQTASQYIIVEAPPSQQDKKVISADFLISTFFKGLSVAFLTFYCTRGLTGAFSVPIGFLLMLGAYFIDGYIDAPVK